MLLASRPTASRIAAMRRKAKEAQRRNAASINIIVAKARSNLEPRSVNAVVFGDFRTLSAPMP
jgi:hypothetical protein